MHVKTLHHWQLNPKDAAVLQRQLAGQVARRDVLPGSLRLIAGVDVSCRRRAEPLHAAVVLLDYTTMDRLEVATASGTVDFPYIPGLLSFRELPVLLQAFRKLTRIPDLVLVDGQGLAHPRRLGLASHLGLWLDLPTIGCAKSRLCGVEEAPGPERGAWAPLCDGGEVIGRLVRSKDRVRPLYVSIGHKIDLPRATEIVLHCSRGYRLPEPTRQAHLLSNQLRLSSGALARSWPARP